MVKQAQVGHSIEHEPHMFVIFCSVVPAVPLEWGAFYPPVVKKNVQRSLEDPELGRSRTSIFPEAELGSL